MFKKEEFLAYLSSKGFSPDTLRYKQIYLEQFYLWLLDKNIKDIKKVTAKTIQKYKLYLINDYRKKNGKKLTPLTVLSKLTTLRKYFSYLLKQRLIFLDPMIDIELPKSRDYLPKNILTQQEAEHLLTLPENTTLGIRDRAILEILYSSGIRRAEACNLDLYDINLKDKTLHIRYPKNRKDRIIPIGEKAKQATEVYLLTSRPKLAQNLKESALFLSLFGRRIQRHSLNYIIRSYSKRMRLNKRITPHCLRHSCATHLLQNGANLAIIMQILGHSRIDTTEIYTRISPQDLKEAIRRYHPRGHIKKIDFFKKDSILKTTKA